MKKSQLKEILREGLLRESGYLTHTELIKLIDEISYHFAIRIKELVAKGDLQDFLPTTIQVHKAVNPDNYSELKGFLSGVRLNIAFYEDYGINNSGSFTDGGMWGEQRVARLAVYVDEETIEDLDVYAEEMSINEIVQELSIMKPTLVHELQHAYDCFRSNGNFNQVKDRETILKKLDSFRQNKNYTGDNWGSYNKEYNKYRNFHHEINARVTETLMNIPLEMNGEIIPFNKFLELFSYEFDGWDILRNKAKKRLQKRLFNYYTQYKEKKQ